MSIRIVASRAPGARAPLRAALLGSCCVAALGLSSGRAAAQELADCDAPTLGTQSCTLPADGAVAGAQVLYTGPTAPGGSDRDAEPAGVYTLTNNQILNDLATGGQFASLALRLRGGQGANDDDDAGASGAGGKVTLINTADATLEQPSFAAHSGDDSAAGLWDRGGLVFNLYAASVGGEGRDAREQTFGGGDGGRGGDGGTVEVTNSGDLRLQPATPTTSPGVERGGAVGIFAGSSSGSGGERDTTDGEPRGGDAGDAGSVTVTNTGDVSLCDSFAGGCARGDAPMSTLAAGIFAQSAAGHGADPTSQGGDAGRTVVDSLGDILVRALVDRAGRAYGIFASSQGGYAGKVSRSLSVDGGDGGDSGAVRITHDGRIVVDAGDFTRAATPEDLIIDRACPEGAVCKVESVPSFIYQSAGILGATYGAAGGATHDGLSRADGGAGGDAGWNKETETLETSRISLARGASVEVTGDNVMGVALYAQGALGGLGNSTDTNGGRGGDTGDLEVALGARATISTSGENAVGVMMQAKGGSGGGVRTSSGLVEFHDESAGRGGNAGNLTLILPTKSVQTAPVVVTEGDRAIGIVMQSLAGGGGSADVEYSLISAGETKGGNSGTAGRVRATGRFSTFTDGYGAHGLLMQSIAGGGGALTTDGAGISADGGDDEDDAIVVAGGGGDGTPGGDVELYSYGGLIQTLGDASIGAVMQSIGGGGGDVIDVGGVAGIFTVGGQGGAGGTGGTVNVTLDSGTRISTEGKYSFGLLAQSIGRGGGNGGDVFTIAGRLPNAALGGDGASDGNNGGTVEFRVEADGDGDRNRIDTRGDSAHGAVLQSIGGGGGTGGDARSLAFGLGALSSVAIGGEGADGGDGGRVSVDAEALDISTTGSHARGLIAHSIGRGGGAGGSASSTDVSLGFGSAVSVGGKGGGGGDGGTLFFNLDDASISTGGDALRDGVANNHGIVAQSIGGGGGTGGSADALAMALDLPIPEADTQVAIAGAAAVGGKGGNGGEGGSVALRLGDVRVTTRGDGAHGILAHSVGGGGGDGGDGTSMAVASLLLDRILEFIPGGEESNAKSLRVNTSVSIGMGGNGGAGGTGGDVDVRLGGATLVETFGPSSNAILAQSVAKGGGNGGVAGAGTKKFGEGAGVKMKINMGGYGGEGASNAGRMSTVLGEETYLRTQGEGSRGLVMHSIGGGGGASQTASVAFTSKLTDAIMKKLGGVKAPRLSIGVGMTGSNGGDGGRIAEADLAGAIETFGADADGVLIQSIGGGGGLGGAFGGGGAEEDGERTKLDFVLELQEIKEQIARPWALSLNVGGTGGDGGKGGDFAVSATQVDSDDADRFMMPRLDGVVVTHGDYADGVALQSIGGGGGVGGGAVPHDSIGFLDLSLRIGGTGGAGNTGGNVGFALGEDAQVVTYGDRAHGVILQSVGGGGGMGGSASRLVGNLGLEADTEAPEEDGEPQTNDDPAFEELDLYELYGDPDEALPAAAIRLGLGESGDGGAGGDGARAEANGEGGRIATSGAKAFGLVVQSIGGGGGIGGIGTAPLTAAELALEHIDIEDRDMVVDDLNALFRGAHLDFIAGGDGGRGGNGGQAVAQGAFEIVTSGVRSPALIVQSVGGGGGLAGIEGAKLLRHGSDGAIGDSGPVRAQLEAGSKISTDGLASHAVIVQSVAGGGGTTMATMAYGSALRRYDPESAPQSALDLLFDVALGAGEATAATARAGGATLKLEDDITTRGPGAYAAIVQSIGGGGGVVSLTPAEIDRARTTALSSGKVAMGSAAQCATGIVCGGADRFDVTLGEGAYITTLGAGSRGVVAQSVQSGGGVATGFELLERATAGESAKVTREISILGANAFPDVLPAAASVKADGDIQTLGADADGLVAQAIGGGGGVIGAAGGASWTFDEDKGKRQAPGSVSYVPDSNSYSMRIDLGQSTAQAGIQNLGLTAALGGAIRTWGDYAEAAIVQSISGGGGVAGLSHDPTSDSAAAVSVRVGASGTTSAGAADRQRAQGLDANAAAGRIEATLTGDFATSGWGANGVVLQEIMGGGGIAAIGSTTLRAAASDSDDRNGLRVGGDYGGTFGSAALSATMGEGARIRTSGDGAVGLLAQNVVGGGGVGALGTSLEVRNAARVGVADVRVGGANSTGQANANGDAIADPGALSLEIGDAILATRGEGAPALLAQSVGGGGGLALIPATWANNATLGTSGGGSSYGGAVSLEMGVDAAGPSLVQTEGDASRGVSVQSVSGGGGQLSTAAFATGWFSDRVSAQLGATGAATGWTDDVEVLFGGAIATAGAYSDGLAVQSIAGGGGIADFGKGQGDGPGLTLALGQTQGGGRAGLAQLTHSGRGEDGGAIFTEGAGAYGMVVQSIGGGGGLASFADTAGDARLTLGATSASGDDRAAGKVWIQREYLGEGASGVETGSLGQVITQGDDAHAIVAQSISGGGGVARLGGARGTVTLQLGGRGGDGANAADTVNVAFDGRMVTAGDRAIGIVAQSISGGGGIASAGEARVSDVRLGGVEGYVGTARAGDVDVTLGGPQSCSMQALDTCAMTFGEGAHGIVAQSIAGGGGIGGDVSLAEGLTLVYSRLGGAPPTTIDRMNGAGNAGYVGVNIDKPLITHGDGAYGVIAQSLGGGGGLGGDARGPFAGLTATGDTGQGGAIDFIMQPEAAVIANGRNSTAVFLQSLGASNGRGTGDVWIDAFVNGLIQGGSGDSAYGILMHGGGAENAITVFKGATVTALSGEAIRYVSRNDPYDSHLSIRNSGVIDGTVSFVKGRTERGVDGSQFGPRGIKQPRAAIAGVAAQPMALAVRPAPQPSIDLVNRRGGVLRGAERYDAHVLNRGLLVAGEAGEHSALAIAGDLTMGPQAVLAVDAEPLKGRGDVISVAGDLTLDGALSLAPRALIGGAEHRLIEVDGDISGAFDRLGGAIFRFEQVVENNGVTVRASGVELASAPGLGGQERAAAGYLERLFLTGERDFAGLFGRLEAAAQGGGLGQALSGATLGASLAGEAAAFELTRERFDTLLSCGEAGGRSVSWGGEGAGCLTLLGSGRSLDQDGSGAAAGYEGDAWTAGFAAALEVAPGWQVSGALGWETLNLARQGGGGSVEGTTGFLGAGLTREMGALALSGAATAAWSEFDGRRAAGPLAPGQARSEHGALSLGLRARAAWTQALDGGAWLKPSLDLDLIHVASEGFSETGAGRHGLRVADADETAFVVTPSLEAGLRRELGESAGQRLGLRAWARAGVSLSSLDSYSAEVRFARDATGIAGFVNGAAQSQVVGRLGLGAALEVGEQVDLGVSYEGALGDGYAGHTGRLSVNVRF